MSSKSVILIIVIYLLVGCNKSDDKTFEEPAPRTYQDIENDFKAFDFTPGVNYFYVQSYGHENARYYNFEIILPSAEDSEKKPLIVYFPVPDLEYNNGQYSYVHPKCLLEAMAESMEAVILIFDSWYYFFLGDRSKDEEMKVTMIELATKYLNVNPSKILVTGFGYGANDAFYFAENYPELFSAAIPIHGFQEIPLSPEEIKIIRTPMYLIFGEYRFTQAEPTLIQMESFVQQANNLGSNITLIIAPTVGTTQCDYVPYLKNGIDWLQTEVWIE